MIKSALAAPFVGLVLSIVATANLAGWLLRVPALLSLFPGAAMVIETALCFGLVALALLADLLPRDARRRFSTALGAALALVTTLVLVEHVSGIDFGIDWADLHRWYADTNPHPGRMSPPTAVGFLCCGAALVLMHRVAGTGTGIVVQCLTALTIATGVVGLGGYVLRLPLVFRDYFFGQMAPVTACGLILSGAGLWLCWRREAWYLSRRLIARSEHRIVLAGAVVLASIVSGAVLAGVIVMQQHAEEIARADRLEILKGRVDLFRINIDLRSTRAALVASRPNLTEQLARLNADPGNGPALARLRNAAESFLPWGFSALAFRDANGRELVQHGRFAAAPEMAFELRSRNAATLLWDNGYVLRSRMPMLDDGKVVGYMSAEQRLPVLTASMQGVETGSQSAEVAVCGRIHDGFECFPQRFVKHAFFLPYSQTLPMAHALAGDLGVRIARDYRGENVLAAHGPIGDFGLGMVVKIDTAELFAPLRESLSLVFLLLLMMLIAGTWLIYRNIAPLARELALSEARLALALESSGIALFDWDMQTNLVYLGAQWEAMLGREPLETVVPAVQLQEITHPEDRAALAKHLHAVLKGGTPKYDLEHRVQAADGQWIWIRSRGRTVEHNHQGRATRLIGTNADITARKAAEFALSHRASHDVLTGLPNRSLFNDRLALAVARAKRNKTLMAVMYLDIDKFKSINDTLGHDAGDLLLKEFSGRLAGCVRNTDTAARLGGDEFVVILESLPAREDGHRIAEKIVAAMRAEFVLAGRALTVTTSAGMAFLEAGVEADPDALLKKADEALYKAKAAGRNNFQMAG